MEPTLQEIVQQISHIKQAAQMTLDQSTDEKINGLIQRAINDLSHVEANIYTMTEQEITSTLERTLDFVNNCGASFEIVR